MNIYSVDESGGISHTEPVVFKASIYGLRSDLLLVDFRRSSVSQDLFGDILFGVITRHTKKSWPYAPIKV